MRDLVGFDNLPSEVVAQLDMTHPKSHLSHLKVKRNQDGFGRMFYSIQSFFDEPKEC